MVDRRGLRALDAVQLASCHVARTTTRFDDPVFVASDPALLVAARREDFEVRDPAKASERVLKPSVSSVELRSSLKGSTPGGLVRTRADLIEDRVCRAELSYPTTINRCHSVGTHSYVTAP